MTIHKIFGEIVESERLRNSATSCHHHYHLPTLTQTQTHTETRARDRARQCQQLDFIFYDKTIFFCKKLFMRARLLLGTVVNVCVCGA